MSYLKQIELPPHTRGEGGVLVFTQAKGPLKPDWDNPEDFNTPAKELVEFLGRNVPGGFVDAVMREYFSAYPYALDDLMADLDLCHCRCR